MENKTISNFTNDKGIIFAYNIISKTARCELKTWDNP